MKLRKALPKDIEVLGYLMKELSGRNITADQIKNRLQFIGKSKSELLFVCEDKGKVIGLLGFRIRENLEEVTRYGEVSVIVVDPHKRCQSVGRFMMNHAESLAKEYNCIGTWLVSGFGREEPAHEFYKKLGYQINGYRFIKLFNH